MTMVSATYTSWAQAPPPEPMGDVDSLAKALNALTLLKAPQ